MNITLHITLLFNYNNKIAKMEKPCVTKLGHPMIQLPVDPLLASNNLD